MLLTSKVTQKNNILTIFSKLEPESKLGRIRSNSFEFRFFEFWILNLNVEFGRIRHIRPNSIEFDLKFIRIRPNSTILRPNFGQIQLI